MRDHFHYNALGLRIASELELPGNPESDAPDVEPDVTIRQGKVPEAISKPLVSGAAFAANEHELLLTVPNVGRYWVNQGREIVIEAVPKATDAELRLFLLGSAMGAVLHMHHILPLHASAIQIGDACVAFAGPSGSGKSTLAAALHQRGYPVVTDDVCAIKIDPTQGPIVFAGFRRLKLWDDTVKALKFDQDDLVRLRGELEKFEFKELHHSNSQPLPLDRFYLLNQIRDPKHDPKGFQPLNNIDALRSTVTNTYRFRYLESLGKKRAHLQTCAELVRSTPVYHWYRHKQFDLLPNTIDELEGHWREAQTTTQSA